MVLQTVASLVGSETNWYPFFNNLYPNGPNGSVSPCFPIFFHGQPQVPRKYPKRRDAGRRGTPELIQDSSTLQRVGTQAGLTRNVFVPMPCFGEENTWSDGDEWWYLWDIYGT